MDDTCACSSRPRHTVCMCLCLLCLSGRQILVHWRTKYTDIQMRGEKKVNSCKIKKERAAYSVLKWMYEPCPLVEYLWL